GSTILGNVLGAAMGKEQRQLLARQARPGAHTVGVDVHEWGGGGWIVANAAALADEGAIAQLLHRHVGKRHVHGLAENVAALAGLASNRAPQQLVGAAGAVAGDNVDRFSGTKLVVDLPDEVDEIGIHLRRLILAPIAQNPVDLLHRLGNGLAVL